MKNLNTVQTIITVANAVEYVAAVVGQVVGGDVSDSIKNQPLTRKVIYDHAATAIANELNAKLGN